MATKTEETTGIALAPSQQSEIDQIRRDGSYQLQRTKEINLVARRMEGLVWGNVSGASLSPQTRHAIAEFCYVIGANEQIHIDILGNKPYINVRFYEDLLNQHEHYIGYDQVNISLSMCKELRAKAVEARASSAQARKDAEGLGGHESLLRTAGNLLEEAYVYEARAREFDLKRAHYEAPDDELSAVYETVIRRYSPLAPVEDIRAGRVADPSVWVQAVSECNWAGSKANDPVGKSHPGLTARSRSFRRAAQKAFSAYMEPKLKQVERAEKMIEAEFEIIGRDNAARSLPANGPQALTSGSGEPTATRIENAQSLPTEDRSGTQPPPTPVSHSTDNGGPHTQPSAPESPGGVFDARAAQQAFFPALREAGISDRKAWQIANGFPESVTAWNAEHFDRAIRLLIHEMRKRADEGARLIGFDGVDALCTAWGVVPESTKDYAELLVNINANIDAKEAGGKTQRSML